VLVYFLLLSISPNRVGFIAIASILLVSLARFLVRYLFHLGKPSAKPVLSSVFSGLNTLLGALEAGAKSAIPVSIACAISGVVVGVIGLTGLGLKFSSLMINLSGGNLLVALLLLVLASLVLGMGLPVTASYIVLAVLAAPALQGEFGVPLVIAHLVIFWYSQDSNVTPPVALAAFAGAGIAGANPMRTGIAAWKFAKGLYLIPLFMIYNPEIVTGGLSWMLLWNLFTAVAALGAFAAVLEGFLFTQMHTASRILATVGVAAVFWPNRSVETLGFVIIIVVLAANWLQARRSRTELGLGNPSPVTEERNGD
jgi:TRAP-type uncharacterized transport system fused permease subunit